LTIEDTRFLWIDLAAGNTQFEFPDSLKQVVGATQSYSLGRCLSPLSHFRGQHGRPISLDERDDRPVEGGKFLRERPPVRSSENGLRKGQGHEMAARRPR
jgi:hypothetical protein